VLGDLIESANRNGNAILCSDSLHALKIGIDQKAKGRLLMTNSLPALRQLNAPRSSFIMCIGKSPGKAREAGYRWFPA